MARIAREAQFTSGEIAIVHVVNRTVRRVFLMGQDNYSGIDYDYRKAWVEHRIEQLAGFFGIDVLAFSILSNHVHLVLRQRPDLVETWDDTEVARRWLMLCPKKRDRDGAPICPTEAELNAIRDDASKVNELRSRLSDISWWMRLLCQTIAQRINFEDQASGKVWENRYRAVRLLDEASLLACAAYVDLNPIRASIVGLLEHCDYTSVQRRIQALKSHVEQKCLGGTVERSGQEVHADSRNSGPVDSKASSDDQTAADPVDNTIELRTTAELNEDTSAKQPDRILAPIQLDELRDALRGQPSTSVHRCSDRGFLNMTAHEYIKLLDWTARTIAPGKPGATPADARPIFDRLQLGISVETWCELVKNFGKLFKIVAGKPCVVDAHRGVVRPKRFKLSQQARDLLQV